MRERPALGDGAGAERPAGRRARGRARLAALCAVAVLAGCASSVGRPVRLDPGSILPGIDPAVPVSVDQARSLKVMLPRLREDLADALVRERIDCHRRFFLNACLADVNRRERRVEDRLDRAEVAANQALREQEAFELNRREAEALAARAADAERDALQREQNRRTQEARVAAAANEQALREAQAPELERQQAANRAERERREAAHRAARDEAARRSAQDAANAERRRAEVEARQREAAEREARERERREQRRADSARRAEEATRRAERNEARDAARRPDAAKPPPAAASEPPVGGGAPAAPR